MSFEDSLNAAISMTRVPKNGRGTTFCVYGALFLDPTNTTLTEEDKNFLINMENSTSKASSTAVKLALRNNNNVEIGLTVVQRHRQQACRCYAATKEN